MADESKQSPTSSSEQETSNDSPEKSEETTKSGLKSSNHWREGKPALTKKGKPRRKPGPKSKGGPANKKKRKSYNKPYEGQHAKNVRRSVTLRRAKEKGEDPAIALQRLELREAERERIKEARELTERGHQIANAHKKDSTRLASVQELAKRELTRRSLINFVQRYERNYKAGWVHKLICQQLEQFAQQVMAGEEPRLMIFMPPRTGKSQLASIDFPAWFIGLHPTRSVIAASYAISLPIGFSRKIKNILEVGEYKATFPTTRLSKDAQAAEAWTTSQGGGYIAAGVGTGITGKGGDILILDDPIKDAQEADSETIRDNAWNWYGCFHPDTELLTRTGWKRVQDVIKDEPVASINPVSGKMVYQYVTDTQQYAFDGELVTLDQRLGASFAVTPNHNVWYRTAPEASLQVCRADELPTQFYLPRAGVFEGGHITTRVEFPAVNGYEKTRQFKTKSWAYFLGLYLSDGVVYEQNNTVRLCATKPAKRDAFRQALEALGVKYVEHPRYFSFASAPVVRYLKQFGTAETKFIPRPLLNSSQEVLQALFAGLMRGDGHQPDAGKRRWRYVTTSPQLADDVYELAAKLGFAVSGSVQPPSKKGGRFPTTNISIREAPHGTHVSRYGASNPMRREVYQGPVYCVTVPPHHTVVTRRNGRVSVSGQSTFRTRLAPGGGILVILCMVGDTPVTMANNTVKALRDVRPGDQVLAYTVDGQVPRTVLNHASQGKDKVLEIRTGNSRVKANARHPFLVRIAQGDVWRRADELQKGDRLVIAQQFAGRDNAVLSQREAWLLGYMYGDGWVTVRDTKNYDAKRDTHYPRRGFVTCVALTHREERNERVVDAFDEVFGVVPHVTKYGYRRTDVARVGRWFTEHGLNGTSKTKRLPKFLFSEPLSIRDAFLDGFVAADGAVVNPERAKAPRVTINLANEDLIKDVRHLARSCGYMPTNISHYQGVGQPPNSPEPIEYHQFNVQWQTTRSDDAFGTTTVREVTPAGEEEVFDLQIEEAENFLADGLVSHNTRWHDDDPAGRLLQRQADDLKFINEQIEELYAEAELSLSQPDAARIAELEEEKKTIEQWRVLSFPALAEHDEYVFPDGTLSSKPEEGTKLLRKKGEALHPERFNETSLKKVKRTLQPRHWSALYQQNPVPDEGVFFTKPMFRFEDSTPDWRQWDVYIAGDLAIGEKQHNDWTVLGAAAMDFEAQIHMLDVIRFKGNSEEIVNNLVSLIERYQKRLICWGLERGAIQLALMPHIERRLTDRRVAATFYDKLKPQTDKAARARPAQGLFQQGRVLLPVNQPWVDPFVQELMRFPGGVHDDSVDMIAWLSRMMLDFEPPRKPVPKGFKSWRDRLGEFTGTITDTGYMGS